MYSFGNHIFIFNKMLQWFFHSTIQSIFSWRYTVSVDSIFQTAFFQRPIGFVSKNKYRRLCFHSGFLYEMIQRFFNAAFCCFGTVTHTGSINAVFSTTCWNTFIPFPFIKELHFRCFCFLFLNIIFHSFFPCTLFSPSSTAYTRFINSIEFTTLSKWDIFISLIKKSLFRTMPFFRHHLIFRNFFFFRYFFWHTTFHMRDNFFHNIRVRTFRFKYCWTYWLWL